MSVLWKKAWVDLRSNRLQNGLIFIILTIAAMSLTIALVILKSSSDPWDRNFEQANGAHIWISSRDATVDFSVLESLPEITETTGRIDAVINHPLILDGEQHDVFIYSLPELRAVAKPLLADGRWVDPESSSEAILDYSFAKYYDLEVGDFVQVLVADGEYTLEIVGTAVSSHWFTYDENTAGSISTVMYTTPNALEKIEPNPNEYAVTYGLRLQDPESSTTFIPKIQLLLNNNVESILDWQWVREISTLATRMIVIFMTFFSLLGLLAVGFIIANAISGQMLAQYREIGMLKAIGLTPRQVMFLFLLENLMMGGAACALGLIFGLLMGPVFASPLAELLNTTSSAVIDPLLILTVVVVVLGGVFLFTAIPAWQAGRIQTVQAIREGYNRRPSQPSRLAGLAQSLGLPLFAVLGVKDVFSQPFRAIFSVIGLSFTVVVLVFGVGADSTIAELSNDPLYYQGTLGNLLVARNFVSNEQTEEWINHESTVENYYTHRVAYGFPQGQTDAVVQRALAGNYQDFEFPIVNGRMIQNDGEAVVGYALIKELGVDLGDSITLITDGKPLTLKIVGYYGEFLAVGRVAMYSLETYHQQINPMAEVTHYNLQLTDGTDAEAIKSDLLAQSGGQFDVTVATGEASASSTQLRDLANLISMILLMIACVNLMSNALLGVRERAREFAIQKTLGFTPRQILSSVMVNVGFLVLLSLTMGIPISIWIFRSFMQFVGQEVGYGPEFGAMNYLGLIVLLPIMLGVVVLSSWLPARRATRIPVAETLRAE